MDLLRAIALFNRVSETGSLSAAAREDHTSQSAVARLIGQLEAHFGVRLFHRTTRQLILTEEGQDLRDYARRLLDTAADMERVLGSSRNAPSGLVRVGLSAEAARLVVPDLGALLERYPELSVELVINDHVGDLIDARLDVALQAGPPSDTSSVVRKVLTYSHVVVAAPSYVARHGAPAHPADLSHHACLVHETSPESAVWRFTGADGPVKIAISSRFRANNGSIVHRAALCGHGIAFLPDKWVAEDIRAGRLHPLLTDYPSKNAEAYIIYPSRRHLAPRTRVVIDFLVAQVEGAQARVRAGGLWKP